MSFAERVRAEGHAQGRFEGRAEALIAVLTLKFGQLPTATISRIRTAPPEETHIWTTRIFTAGTLDELFARTHESTGAQSR